MKRKYACIAAAIFSFSSSLFGQGAADPLTLQGLDQRTLFDVRSRGMGGAVLAAGTNASVLFANPAGLNSIAALELRVAGGGVTASQRQKQEWVPNRLYTGLSLLMEDKWGDIKTPVSTDPWEQLQKPFDTIGPNWSRKDDQALPLSAALAMPLKIADVAFVVGVGGSRSFDLDHFFQNNNVTDPLLGQYRPQPLPELQQGDTLRVRWFQFTRKREGEIWGITPAIGASIAGIDLGVSGTFYTGNSDDSEQRLDRGFLTFLYNRFRIQDTVQYASAVTGTSTYTGFSGTFGVRIVQPRFSVAATLQLPYTLKRKYSSTFQSKEDIFFRSDSVQTTLVESAASGTQKVHFPVAYALGLLLNPFPQWSVAFDYDIRNLDRVDLTLADGTTRKPWLGGSSFRLGAEYRWNEWLALRGGYREVPQSFSPEGAALIGDPAVMSVYSAGVGVNVYGVKIDAAYEYAHLEYQDSWQSNVNYNTSNQHHLLLEFGYQFAGTSNE